MPMRPVRCSRRRCTRQPVVLLLSLALGACAAARPQGGPPTTGTATSVVVRNDLPQDMTIFVVRTGGASFRLGTVMGSSTGEVRIPQDVLPRLGDVLLVARPLGSGAALSLKCGALVPTSTVELVLGLAPALSNCWVR